MVNSTLFNHKFILNKFKEIDRYGKIHYKDEIIVYGKENLKVNTKYLLSVSTFYIDYQDIQSNDLLDGFPVIDAKPHFNSQDDFVFMEVKTRVREKMIG